MGIQYRYQNWRREGTRSALHGLAMRAIKPLAPYRALYGMRIRADDLADTEARPADMSYETRFLDGDEMARFADQEPTLRPKFMREARARGDRCYAILDGDRLASYGWYATRPLVVAYGQYLHFDPSYVYMHSGYTHPDYRGQRLFGIGKAQALRTLSEEGNRGMLACVDTDNVRSLRSFHRLGASCFGVMRVLRIGERAWRHTSPGCDRYGFTLSPSPEVIPMRTQASLRPA